MASRAGSSAATWIREMMLEVIFRDYRGTDSVRDDKVVPDEVARALPLHVVTDCNSLHETVIRSSLPEDQRAAIEVLAIREMIREKVDRGDQTQDGKLCESNVEFYFHWCDSRSMKADVLTKVTTKLQRQQWEAGLNAITLDSVKKAKMADLSTGPSRPRTRIPAGMALSALHRQRASPV